MSLQGIEAATRPTTPVKRGNSRYALVPPDWPQDCLVQVILLPTSHEEA